MMGGARFCNRRRSVLQGLLAVSICAAAAIQSANLRFALEGD